VLFKDIRAVSFIHIRGLSKQDSESDVLSRGLSGRVAANVQALLKSLAEQGQYLHHDPKGSQVSMPLIQHYGPEVAKSVSNLYRRCRAQSVEYSNREIPYKELRPLLKKVAAMDDLATVDISAIKKRYLGDIVAAALVEGVVGLYAFDTKMRPDFDHPWRMLVHEMLDEHEEPKQYEYVNIVDTELYQSCTRVVTVRAPRLAVAISVSMVAMLLSIVMLVMFDSNGLWVRVFMGLSGCASVLALVFVFVPPRGM
jgi:hypothetical protein